MRSKLGPVPLVLASPSPAPEVVLGSLEVVGAPLVTPALPSLLTAPVEPSLAPLFFGAIRGVVIPVQSIGQAVGPILSGLAFDYYGHYGPAFKLYAVLGILAALAAMLAIPAKRKPT